jgi:hypothetical protein
MLEKFLNINWLAVLIGCAISCIYFTFYDRYKKRPIIHKMESDKWQPWNTFPESENIFFTEKYLITDGEKVDSVAYPHYNKNGEMIMSLYNQNKVTHWMPLPNPPKK